MEDLVPFGSRDYGWLLLLLLFSRAMDFLSTWVATPNLVLEGNPVAKKLGWRWGVPVNVVMCVALACWPLPGIVISTTSLLVAARNFQGAWLMRSMGEDRYRAWHLERIEETGPTLFLCCLFAQTALTGLVGAAIIWAAGWKTSPVIPEIGLGIIAYATAVLGYSLLGFYRLRRSWKMEERIRRRAAEGALRSSSKLQEFGAGEGPQTSEG